MVTKEEFSALLNALQSISRKEWQLVLEFDKRLGTVYDHRKELRQLSGALVSMLNAKRTGNEKDTVKWQSDVLHHIQKIKQGVLPAFSALLEKEQAVVSEEEKLARGERETLLQWGPLLKTEIGNLQSENPELEAVKKQVEVYSQRLKYAQVTQSMPDHIMQVTAVMRAIQKSLSELLHSETNILSLIENQVSSQQLKESEVESWIFNIQSIAKSIEQVLREEKDRVVVPLRRFVGEHRHADEIARASMAKDRITAKDIARDIATFTDPHEYQIYQTKLLRHRGLLDPKAEDMLLKGGILAGRAGMHKFFTLDMFRNLAFIDQLTKAHTRHYVQHHWSKMVSEASRYNHNISIIYLDIDHFKSFNDTYSHRIGDRVLATVVSVIKKTVRNEDLVVRWGGEELIVILPRINKNAAIATAERIRRAVESQSVGVMKEINDKFTSIEPEKRRYAITVSGGIATYPDEGQELTILLNIADGRLYYAKNHGRNRIEAAQIAIKQAKAVLQPA